MMSDEEEISLRPSLPTQAMHVQRGERGFENNPLPSLPLGQGVWATSASLGPSSDRPILGVPAQPLPRSTQFQPIHPDVGPPAPAPPNPQVPGNAAANPVEPSVQARNVDHREIGYLPAGDRPDVKALAEENRRLREQRMCKICLESDIDVVLLPCSHLFCCRACAVLLLAAPRVQAGQKARCPVCRRDIDTIQRIFY